MECYYQDPSLHDKLMERKWKQWWISFSWTPKSLHTVTKSQSIMSDSVTPWIVVLSSLLSMGFSRQKYWSGLPFPFLGDLPDPGIKTRSPILQVDSLPTEAPRKLRQ